MKIVLRVLAIFFGLGFLGNLIMGKFFFAGLILGSVCAFYGWKPSAEVVEEKQEIIIEEKENNQQEK